MNQDQTRLPIDPEQPPLPGLEGAAQPPLMARVRDELPEWPLRPFVVEVEVGPDQLSMGPNQQSLSDVEPEAVQLSMLPDPPPWEMPEEGPVTPTPSGRTGRLSKRRNKRGISPGQRSLF